RRILYTMYENGLYPEKAYRKCADTVGAVLGRYHPHGDASVYDALVRMAQDFSLRYMMVDGQGNFGSIDGYPAAAYRYTEAKLSKPAMEMLKDIDKETVDFQANYDDRLKEPLTLPSRIPSLLVNGSQGIAVGMATNIPPHNLGEVVDAMCYLIDNPEAELSDLCEYIKGPDFPTGGVIMGHAGIRAAYATGRGKIILRGKAEIEESHGNCFRIVISEIPYMVNKQNLIKSMMDLVKDKRIEGIDDIADYSSKEGMRIVIELKASANPQVVLNQLYSFTQLQNTFGVIMLALVNGAPKVLTLKEMLQHYIDYQCEIVERRTRFDLKKAKERAHILEALKTALDFIDEVIRLIRASRTVADSKQALADRFGFDEEQTTAIVQMPLGRLSGLEKQKIEDELKDLHAKIADLEDILGNAVRVLTIVKDEALVIRDRFVDDRRTQITAVSGEVDIEDLIPNEECVLTLTHLGYMKRLPTDTYRAQRRGGRGVSGMTRREEDFAEHMFTCFAHDTIMLFTNLGRVYRIKAYEVPESTRTAKGMNIVNILPLQENEKVTVMLRVEHPDEPQYLNMLTRHGVIKRTTLAAFDNIRKGGIIAIDLDEGDELRWVRLTDGNQDLLVATKKGMAIRFHETDARLVGRTARGVKAITLSGEKGDEVVGLALVRENAMLMTVTETGYGRRSEFTDYRLQNRGGKGLTNYKTALYGDVAAVGDIDEGQDIIMITSAGIVIRTAADSVSTYARTAKGVRVMRLDEGDSLVNMTYAEKEAEEEESEATEGEGEAPAESTEE
ncbi:MAG: DNA gyrase subunit A, partial [Clostridia bacterium]|nr:DNA gyrase subunit A [Clostridia bacterium]